uniref:BHLH domain-containing protein n=2 Tax=Fagus sylvatica TaxID=28930 RepID=A0A2N9J1C8_FAGSY
MNRGEMESDLQQHQHHPNQMNSGLTRYRSAPSSYFANILDREFSEDFFNRPSSPETDFARFIASGVGGGSGGTEANNSTEVVATEASNQQPQFMASMNNEAAGVLQQQSNYGSASQNFYQGPSRPPLPNSGVEGSYSMGSDRLPQMKTGGGGGGNNSSLIRQSSSPAGLFSHINVGDGYAATRGMGNFGAGNSTNEEASFSPASRLKNYSTGPPSSSGLMSPIAEIEEKAIAANNPESGGFGEGRSNNYVSGFPLSSWDDSELISDNITGLKRLRDDHDEKPFSNINVSETQNVEAGNRPATVLTHHLSLPKTSSEMAAIEKFLQYQDSVPCKIRAKRGCATHPRSIAERVRRTRISERMRKLQDLVPNMDKQTNTSDMLDLAVEYIKDLQQQVQTLNDNRARCTCSNKQQQ